MLIYLFLLASLFNPWQAYAQQYFNFGPVTINNGQQVTSTSNDNTLKTATPEVKSTSTNDVTKADDTYSDLCLNIDTNGKSSVGKAHDENLGKMKEYEKKILDKNGNIKKDYLVSVVNCAGVNLSACGTDLFKATDVLEYDARLKTSIQLNKEYYKKIEEVKKNTANYIKAQDEDLFKLNTEGGKAAKDLILARVEMAKAESELMDYDNREKISKFVKEDKSKKSQKDLLTNFNNKKQAFDKKIEDLKTADFNNDIPKDSKKTSNYIKGLIQNALSSADADLQVSASDVKADDIYSNLPAGIEVCKDYAKKSDEDKKKCEKLAGQYNAAATTGGSMWSPVKVYTNKDCSFFDNLGATPFNSVMDIIGAYKSLDLENCMMAKGARGCTSQIASVQNFYNDPMKITTPFYQGGQGNIGMNVAPVDLKINTSLTSPQQSSSMPIGGNIPSNIFSAYTPSTNSTGPSATGAGFGGGTGGRVNTDTGATILNNIASQTTAMGTGADNFNNQYNSAVNNIIGFNNNLSGTLTSWVDPNIYLKSAKSVQQDIDKAKGSGPRYPGNTGYDNTIDLRQKITEIDAQQAALFQNLEDQVAKGNSDAYFIKYGSISEQQQAAAHIAMMSGYTDYIKTQMAVLDSQKQLYYMNTNSIIYQQNTVENTFDILQMYAANGNTVYGKRSLTLKPLKTPVTNVAYVLKPGWQDAFKKYIANMLQKAEESKGKMNLAKSKMQKLLAQRIPIIPLEKLPDTISVAKEIRNMESLETVAKKNMMAIESAMEYHKSRKLDTPSNVYAQYEKEADTLKRSMQNVVSSIDQAKPSLDKSYAILSKIDVEVPKAEALKQVAKRMVDQGL